MKIIEKLKCIRYYFEFERMVGHTTDMLNGAKNTEHCVILTHNMCMKKHIEEKLGKKNPKNIIFQSLNSPELLRGLSRPLFIDNAAMWQLCKEAQEEIERLNADNQRLRQLI